MKPAVCAASGSNRALTQQYFPALHTLWWLEWRAFGDNPRGYHVVNLLLHFTACVLLARVVRLLALPGPWFAAALFALHPLCVESVAWITEGKNTLSLCFLLASLASHLRSEGFRTEASAGESSERASLKTSGGDQSDVHVLDSGISSDDARAATSVPASHLLAWYLASLTLFTLAVLSKTNAVALPGVILVILAWKRGRLSIRDVLRIVPMVVIGAAVALIVVGVERNLQGSGRSEFDWPWIERLIVAGRACWFYVAKIFWPHPLSFIYPRWRIDPQDATQQLWTLAAIALPLVLWSLRKRVGAAPLTAVLIFGGTLLPQLGLLPLYGQIFSYVADHWVYLSLVPIVVLVASWLAHVAERRLPPAAVKFGALAILGAAAFLTWRQTPLYRSEVALWTNVLAKNPDCWLAHNNLALKQIDAEDYTSATAHLAQALELRPRFKEAYVNSGLIAVNQNRRQDAAVDFRKALGIDPRMADAHANLAMLLIDDQQWQEAADHLRAALDRNPRFPQARASLGLLLARTGQVDQGLAELRTAMEQDPEDLKALVNLGTVLAGIGRSDEARAVFQRVLQIDPHQAEAQAGMGNLLLAAGDAAGAEAAYRAALETDPRNPDVQFNLGNVLVRRRKPDAAIEAYLRALQLAPDHPSANLNLAAVLAARGRRDEAQRYARKVLASRPDDPQALALLKKMQGIARTPTAAAGTN
ncbi:MAG: tetratricopeptide repeat protein [Pirellulales bacterium]